MKINQHTPSQYGNFSIEATADRDLVLIFTDHETGLLIVEETLVTDAHKNSKSIYATTVHPKTGEIIPLAQRHLYINYSEGEEINADLGVRRIFRRVVNTETGNEFIEEELFALSDGKTLQTSGGVAFRPEKRDTIFDNHKKVLEQRKQIDHFWQQEYPAKTKEEKAKYWAGTLHQQMRWQGESGLDEYVLYSKKWLDHYKNIDKDMEEVLEMVFKDYFEGYWDVQEIKARLNK